MIRWKTRRSNWVLSITTAGPMTSGLGFHWAFTKHFRCLGLNLLLVQMYLSGENEREDWIGVKELP